MRPLSTPSIVRLLTSMLLIVVPLHSSTVRCAIGGQPTSNSLGTDLPLNEQLHRAFFLKDGLPSNWINDVVQTRDGYLWIATDNGVVRFDGINFKRFRPPLARLSAVTAVRVLFEDRAGDLWIGSDGGLERYRPGPTGGFEQAKEVSETVHAIYEDRAGTIWVGTKDHTYARRPGMQFKVVQRAPVNVRAFCEDHEGTIWIGSHFGLFRQNGDAFEQITHERLPALTSASAGVSQTRVNVIVPADDGSLWIGTNRTLLHRRNGQFTSRGQELDAQQVYDILQTNDGSTYVAARFGLFRSVDNGVLEEVSSDESALSVTEDRDGGLWVGYGDNRGLHHYRNNLARAVWNRSRIRCLFDDSGGSLWFGANGGLHRLRDGVITDFGLADGLPDLRIQSITPGSGKSLWIGTARGFAKWTGQAIDAAEMPASTNQMNVGAAMEDSHGVLWFALASAGGFRLKDGELIELAEFRANRIRWFWEQPGGPIWIGHESGLYHYNGREFLRVDAPALDCLKNPRFNCHYVDDDGALWMGTSNGIARYHHGEFNAFPPESGLGADDIERLVGDGLGNLWFGGRDGLFFARAAELEGLAKGRLSKIATSRIEGFDRFPPLNAFSQGCLVKDGELWIASEHGLTCLPTNSFQKPPATPVVYINDATVDDRRGGHAQPFRFPSGRRRLSIEFSSPALVSPERIEYRYRLDGHDDEWLHAGSDRTAQYTDLRPGSYQFRVAARNGNNEWVEATEPFRIAVTPRWWEIMWLRVSGLFVVALAGIGLAHFRIRRFRTANAELRREIAERQLAEKRSRDHQEQLARVSRAASMGELTTSIAHEVKQPLFAIVSNAQTARRLLDREVPDVDEVREALSDIADDGNRASGIIDRVRSLVKKEHPVQHHLDLNEVAREAVAFSEPEIARMGFEIETEFASSLPAITGDPIELQQVILNLLINAAQAMSGVDAETRRIELKTTANTDSVELAVADQGTGFHDKNLEKLFVPFFTTKPQGTGMGLSINRSIIEAHGGRIWATQNRDRGLTFHFSLPAGLELQNKTETLRQGVTS